MLTAIGVHVFSSIGEFLIWRSIPNSPNRQIKNLAKVFRYTVCPLCVTVVVHVHAVYVCVLVRPAIDPIPFSYPLHVYAELHVNANTAPTYMYIVHVASNWPLEICLLQPQCTCTCTW